MLSTFHLWWCCVFGCCFWRLGKGIRSRTPASAMVSSTILQASLNESSSQLLIGWDHAIPRDCLAETERPCIHSQKRWYAILLFHSHKSLNIAWFFCGCCCLICALLPPLFFCCEALIVPLFSLSEEADMLPGFFNCSPGREERCWEGLQCEICSGRARAEAAYEWVSLSGCCSMLLRTFYMNGVCLSAFCCQGDKDAAPLLIFTRPVGFFFFFSQFLFLVILFVISLTST